MGCWHNLVLCFRKLPHSCVRSVPISFSTATTLAQVSWPTWCISVCPYFSPSSLVPSPIEVFMLWPGWFFRITHPVTCYWKAFDWPVRHRVKINLYNIAWYTATFMIWSCHPGLFSAHCKSPFGCLRIVSNLLFPKLLKITFPPSCHPLSELIE